MVCVPAPQLGEVGPGLARGERSGVPAVHPQGQRRAPGRRPRRESAASLTPRVIAVELQCTLFERVVFLFEWMKVEVTVRWAQLTPNPRLIHSLACALFRCLVCLAHFVGDEWNEEFDELCGAGAVR